MSGAVGRSALEEFTRDLAALSDDYAQRLPQRLREAIAPLSAPDGGEVEAAALEEAASLLHRLRGTAASYGFGAVGAALWTLEQTVSRVARTRRARRAASWHEVTEAIHEAERAVDAVIEGLARRMAAPGAAPSRATTRVLVVDSDRAFLDAVVELAKGLLIEVVPVSDEAEAVAQAGGRAFDGVFIDAGLANATSLARRLRELPGRGALPLAFLSSSDGLDRRVEAVHARASLFLRKPLDAETFGNAVSHLTAAARGGQPLVIVVDDDRDFGVWAEAVLRAGGVRVTIVGDPRDLLDVLAGERPDLLILDAAMPAVGGLDLCRLVRSDPVLQEVPVLCLTADATPETRIAAFEAGADDYLPKPVIAAELVSRVRVRIDRARLRAERAERDSLTGLLLRRSFLEQATARLAEASRTGGILSVALLDLDDFKRVNDRHGHLTGDRVLAALGSLIANRLRAEDVRARWGGEEFALVFPGQGPRTAELVVARLLAELEAVEFRGDDGALFTERFSAGVASFPADGMALTELLRVADRRLYRAKAAGRGRVVVEGE